MSQPFEFNACTFQRRFWMSVILTALCLSREGVPVLAEDRASTALANAGQTEEWQVILMNGQRVGFAHSITWNVDREGQAVTVTEVVTHMSVKRFGGTLTSDISQRTEEDPQGRLLSFTLIQDNKPFSRTETRGEVIGDTLSIQTTSSGKSFQKEITLTPDVKSATYFERSLKEKPLQVGQSRTFQMFEPSLSKVTQVTVKQLEPAETKLLHGGLEMLDRAEMTQTVLPGVSTIVFTSPEGETRKMTVSLLGMETYTCSAKEALQEIAAANIDLGLDTLIKVGQIDRPLETRQVTYRLTPTDYDPRTIFAETPLQHITPSENGSYLIEVHALDAGTTGQESAPEDKYLSSSRFLDLSDPLIQKLSHDMAHGETDPVKIAILAEAFVHKHLKLKNFSTALATATEVAASQSGDCTEHAILLAAVLRVQKIPSRVVTGLVYVPALQAFGGHMWTEAFIHGRWVPLDGTLAQGHGDAIHLKSGDSALEESDAIPVEQFLPLIHVIGRSTLKIENIEHRR